LRINKPITNTGKKLINSTGKKTKSALLGTFKIKYWMQTTFHNGDQIVYVCRGRFALTWQLD
jgi:hypothetical protein